MRVPDSLYSTPLSWPPDIDRERVRRATSRLIGHITSQATPDGAIRERCESRVLESSLTLALMDRLGHVSPERDRLLGFLTPHLDSPHRLDRVLSGLAIRRASADPVLAAKLTEAVLGATPGFLSARRRKMVGAVLKVLGCPLPQDAVPTESGPPPTDPIHSWAAVQQAAITLILADGPSTVTEAALRTLKATEPEAGVWEGYTLMHVLTLHALAGVPGERDTARRALKTLLTCQRADGGFPFVMEMDNWCTATSGIALAAAGAPARVVRHMAGFVAAHQGGAPLPSLARGVTLSGGWSMSPAVAQNDVDDTSCALEFLQRVDPVAFGGQVRRGVDALLAVQGADGGFPTYVAGASSEPCMTAAAVGALAPHPVTAPARERALAFLADAQKADGGFEPGWSRSRLHTLFRARLAACTADPRDARTAAMAARIERTVRETQNADGGWGMRPGDASDDISTAYGLIALCYGDGLGPIGRATAWLLDRQDADGGYSGPPDMVGPRPFDYHFPVLTDAPVLLAFGHLRARVVSEPPVRARVETSATARRK